MNAKQHLLLRNMAKFALEQSSNADPDFNTSAQYQSLTSYLYSNKSTNKVLDSSRIVQVFLDNYSALNNSFLDTSSKNELFKLLSEFQQYIHQEAFPDEIVETYRDWQKTSVSTNPPHYEILDDKIVPLANPPDISSYGETQFPTKEQAINYYLSSLGEKYNGNQKMEIRKGMQLDMASPILQKHPARSIHSNDSIASRLYIDMDGTLATWQPVSCEEELFEQGFYRNLKPNQNVVDAAKIIISEHPEIEVHILSAVLTDSKYALSEKKEWLQEYLPEIKPSQCIFSHYGKDKTEFITGGVRPTDFLLDDYTNNLTLWEPPAKGIKLLNGINSTNGTWKGNQLDFTKPGKELAEDITAIIETGIKLRDIPPQQKNTSSIKEENRIKQTLHSKPTNQIHTTLSNQKTSTIQNIDPKM